MGLDYDSLKERYPRLVYGILLGYGEKGPKVDFPGFDAIAMFATSGFIQDMMVDAPGAYPIYLPMGMGDLICGTILSGAIGTALLGRERTGKGDYVSVSLYGAGMWLSASCPPAPSSAISGPGNATRAVPWVSPTKPQTTVGSSPW